MKRLFLSLILIFATITISYGSTGGDIFRTGLVGPNLVLSEVYNGVTSAGGASLYNPSSLAVGSQLEFYLKYGSLSVDRKYSQIYLGSSIGKFGGIGLSFISSGIDGIPGKDIYGNSTGDIDYNDTAFVLSYGVGITSDLDIGVNAKYLKTKLAEEKATGFGVDLGTVYSPVKAGFFKDLKVHISLSDIYTMKKWDSGTKNIFPLTLRLGSILPLFNRRLLLGLDIESIAKPGSDLIKSENINLRFGSSYQLVGNLNIFGGIGADLSYFAGINLAPPSWYRIDYKVNLDSLGVNHWVTLEFRAGESIRFASAQKERIKVTTERDKLIKHYIKAVELDSEKKYEESLQEIKEVLKIDPKYKPAKILQKEVSKRMKERLKEITTIEEKKKEEIPVEPVEQK